MRTDHKRGKELSFQLDLIYSAHPHFIKKDGGFKGGTVFRREYYAKRGGGKNFRKWMMKHVKWDAWAYYDDIIKHAKAVRRANYVYREQSFSY